MTDPATLQLLKTAAERAAQYLESLDRRSVQPVPEAVLHLKKALSAPLPDRPSEAADVLALLDRIGSPATIASAGGRYFGFVTGGVLPATLAANYLAGACDQNSFSAVSSPAIAAFEETALRWVKQALDLPEMAEGTFVTGATMANFTGLAAARHHVLAQAGWDVERQGLFGAPAITVLVGAEVHAIVYKVLSLLGIGRDRVMSVPCDNQGRMRANAVPDIKGPTILCLQAGNVNTGAFDPASAIIARAQEAGAWVHVDGAFGLWARASQSLASLAAGLEAADSWAMDMHKWPNLPYDCGVALVRNPEHLRRAMAISGAYIAPSGRRDQIEFSPDSSRRARAVEVWAALKSLGRSGLAELIERNCRQARDMALQLAAGGVEIMNDVVLNQVLARLGDDERTRRVIAAVQNEGTCWCGGTVWQGKTAMRISVSSWATTDEDIARSADAILAASRATN